METIKQRTLLEICNKIFKYHGLDKSSIPISNYSHMEIREMIITATKLGFSAGLTQSELLKLEIKRDDGRSKN